MNGEDRRGLGVAEVEFTNKMTPLQYAKNVLNGEERRGLGAEVELTNKMSPIPYAKNVLKRIEYTTTTVVSSSQDREHLLLIWH